jgi:glycosyltransferase involved in cell wall biosynthesis
VNKQPHVLYVLTKLELGGAQKICLSLLKGVQQKGITSGLISGTEGVLVDEAKKHNSVYLNSVYLIDSLKREVGLRSIVLELKTFFRMISYMKKLKQKTELVVHTHSTKAGIFGRWAAFFAGVKTRIHTVHGFGFHEYQKKVPWVIHYLFELFVSFITTHYVCVSKLDVETGKKLIPRFGKKSSIIRAAVSWDSFYLPAVKLEQKNKKQFLFGTVSCFKPQKNLFDLLRAFHCLHTGLPFEKKDSVVLQIIGDGALRGQIEEWIAKHNMQKNILLLGWQDNVASFLKTWDAFVMSSLWEGLPCSIVEARLSKLPVVSYNIGGVSEVIKNGENGFLIKPGDWKALAWRMEQLLLDEQLYGAMSANKEDLNDFNDKVMIEKHINLYKQFV